MSQLCGLSYGYLPIHMLAWQESVEGSWTDGSLLAPSADSTSAAWLEMSWYSWMNWYRFMMRDASIIPVSLLIWENDLFFVSEHNPAWKYYEFKTIETMCLLIRPVLLFFSALFCPPESRRGQMLTLVQKQVVSPWCRGPWRPPSTRRWHQILAAPQTAGASVARQRAWQCWDREKSSSTIHDVFAGEQFNENSELRVCIRNTPRLTCRSVRRLVPEIPRR